MGGRIVFWRNDGTSDEWHLYSDCPTLNGAERDGTLREGSVDASINNGCRRLCLLCKKRMDEENRRQVQTTALGTPQGQSEPCKSTKPEKSNTPLYLWIAVFFLANSVWIVGLSENQSGYSEGYDAGYEDGYADGKTGRAAPQSTPKPTAKPTPTPTPTPKTTPKTAGEFWVTATAEVVYNDHVGNDWYYYFEANDTKLPHTIYCQVGDDVQLYAEAVEDDNVPDVGSNYSYVTVEAGDFEDGFTATDYVYVYETSGRYSGNEAKIKVVWNFVPR